MKNSARVCCVAVTVVSIVAASVAPGAVQQDGDSAAPKLALELRFDGGLTYYDMPTLRRSYTSGPLRLAASSSASPLAIGYMWDSKIEGAGVRVNLALKFGAAGQPYTEKQVASYLLQLNRPVYIRELAENGFDGCWVRLIRMNPEKTPPPSFRNSSAKSVEIVGIERRKGWAFPDFLVSVKNVSDKTIIALSVRKDRSDSPLSYTANGATPLIAPGATWGWWETEYQNLRGRDTAEGFVIDGVKEIEIKTATFYDGS